MVDGWLGHRGLHGRIGQAAPDDRDGAGNTQGAGEFELAVDLGVGCLGTHAVGAEGEGGGLSKLRPQGDLVQRQRLVRLLDEHLLLALAAGEVHRHRHRPGVLQPQDELLGQRLQMGDVDLVDLLPGGFDLHRLLQGLPDGGGGCRRRGDDGRGQGLGRGRSAAPGDGRKLASKCIAHGEGLRGWGTTVADPAACAAAGCRVRTSFGARRPRRRRLPSRRRARPAQARWPARAWRHRRRSGSEMAPGNSHRPGCRHPAAARSRHRRGTGPRRLLRPRRGGWADLRARRSIEGSAPPADRDSRRVMQLAAGFGDVASADSHEAIECGLLGTLERRAHEGAHVHLARAELDETPEVRLLLVTESDEGLGAVLAVAHLLAHDLLAQPARRGHATAVQPVGVVGERYLGAGLLDDRQGRRGQRPLQRAPADLGAEREQFGFESLQSFHLKFDHVPGSTVPLLHSKASSTFTASMRSTARTV